jgi:hypothetical protein
VIRRTYALNATSRQAADCCAGRWVAAGSRWSSVVKVCPSDRRTWRSQSVAPFWRRSYSTCTRALALVVRLHVHEVLHSERCAVGYHHSGRIFRCCTHCAGSDQSVQGLAKSTESSMTSLSSAAPHSESYRQPECSVLELGFSMGDIVYAKIIDFQGARLGKGTVERRVVFCKKGAMVLVLGFHQFIFCNCCQLGHLTQER